MNLNTDHYKLSVSNTERFFLKKKEKSNDLWNSIKRSTYLQLETPKGEKLENGAGKNI